MATSVSGKVVLVTGASAGIGRATAVALSRAGAKVIATGRRQDELDSLAKECGGGGRDLGRRSQRRALQRRAGGSCPQRRHFRQQCRRLEICPAARHGRRRHRGDVPHQRARLFPHYPRRRALDGGLRRRGHIIVMTSIAAREVYPLGVIYCTTKHALSAFARGLRVELQGHGIKVTEIAPGMVDTGIRAPERPSACPGSACGCGSSRH